MDGARVTIQFKIETKDQPNAHTTTFEYNGMDAKQIAQFELDLLEGIVGVQKVWMSRGKIV